MGIFSQLVLRVFQFENLPDDVLMEKLYLKASKTPEMHFILLCCTFCDTEINLSTAQCLDV